MTEQRGRDAGPGRRDAGPARRDAGPAGGREPGRERLPAPGRVPAPARDSGREPTRETAQTLDRGLRLLLLVADAADGVTVTEAAEALGVGRAVVYRLVGALVTHGMVRRDGNGRLRLGAGVLHLARRAQPLLVEGALPALRRLAEEVGATAHLTVAEGTEAVALAVVEPSWTAFHVAYRAGSRHPLSRGAAGRAILAGREGLPEPVATSGELQTGAYGVAAPVLGVDGLDASVGVVALAPLDLAEVGKRVGAAARAVSAALTSRL